jgi:hypothetical protein
MQGEGTAGTQGSDTPKAERYLKEYDKKWTKMLSLTSQQAKNRFEFHEIHLSRQRESAVACQAMGTIGHLPKSTNPGAFPLNLQ